jgi:hypothetical protein
MGVLEISSVPVLKEERDGADLDIGMSAGNERSRLGHG